MGPRLGRVEYEIGRDIGKCRTAVASMGPRLGRVEYIDAVGNASVPRLASMGPRLGRVEYQSRGSQAVGTWYVLQWGHA